MSGSPLASTDKPATREQVRQMVSPVEMPFSLWTLRFRDPQHDADFSLHVCQKMLRVVRITLLMGCLIYASFGILDALVAPEVLHQALKIRLGLVCPIILAAFFLTFKKNFLSNYHFILSLVTVSALGGIIYIISAGNDFIKNNYFIGILIVMFYCGNLFYTRFLFMLCTSIITNIFYFYWALHFGDLERNVIYSHIFFMTAGSGLSLYCCYAQEFFLMKNYISNINIRRNASRIEDLYIKANAANHAKSEFLTIMSHELRTPLNAIIGFSDLIAGEMMGPLQNEKYKEYAIDINNSGKHLLCIINDILDLTRAETGKMQLNEGDFAVADALDVTLNMMIGKAGEKGVHLALDSPGETVFLHADERLIRQAVINLLSNAIKFTDSGKHVIVSYTLQSDGSLNISVTDEGIGIPQEDMERVLEPFVQVENSFTRVNDGIGIGLPLVRRIIELHDGKMTLSSTVGAGTCVTLHIPAIRVLPYARSSETLSASAAPEAPHDRMAQ